MPSSNLLASSLFPGSIWVAIGAKEEEEESRLIALERESFPPRSALD